MWAMNKTLFGQSPTRYGLASLAAACLAFAIWPLMIVIGFGVVYVALLLALVAIVAGVLGIGSGLYYKQWPAYSSGALAIALIVFGGWYVASAITQF